MADLSPADSNDSTPVARKVEEGFEQSDPPPGAWAAAGEVASSVVAAAKQGNPDDHVASPSTSASEKKPATAASDQTTLGASREDEELTRDFANGYHFPPKYSTGTSWKHGAIAFWKFSTKPLGFLIVLYSLNVVAWGGMLFLLLCNAAPAMCYPDCNDINSPRRKWVEWDSQILNALFCVTGFGLAPWRFRDMYWLMRYRILKEHLALRRLAGIHKSWFRLAGSQDIPVDVGPDNVPADLSRDVIPYPENKLSNAPLTGVRAPPTKMWKLDFVLWMNIGNTFLQCCLSGVMWGLNRYDRPSWTTGFLVAFACIVGAIGGFGSMLEGKTVKSIEGVPLTDEDREKLASDKAQGIYHYNNIQAKKPKKKKAEDPEQGQGKRRRFGLGHKKGGS